MYNQYFLKLSVTVNGPRPIMFSNPLHVALLGIEPSTYSTILKWKLNQCSTLAPFEQVNCSIGQHCITATYEGVSMGCQDYIIFYILRQAFIFSRFPDLFANWSLFIDYFEARQKQHSYNFKSYSHDDSHVCTIFEVLKK